MGSTIDIFEVGMLVLCNWENKLNTVFFQCGSFLPLCMLSIHRCVLKKTKHLALSQSGKSQIKFFLEPLVTNSNISRESTCMSESILIQLIVALYGAS